LGCDNETLQVQGCDQQQQQENRIAYSIKAVLATFEKKLKKNFLFG